MIRNLFNTFLGALMLLISGRIQAQEHVNAWFRGTVDYHFSERLKGEAELQHRRQNEPYKNRFPSQNLTYSFRSWIHYEANKQFRFSLSPFAVFENYRIIREEKDKEVAPEPELRFTLAAQWNADINRKLRFINRFAAEYRIYEHSPRQSVRLRERAGLEYRFNPTLSLLFYEELLLNATGSSENRIDQNRLALLFIYKPVSRLKIELGYMYLTRKPEAPETTINESNFLLNLTWSVKKLPREAG